MYVRLVVTFCSSEKVIKPKEAHIDFSKLETIPAILDDCMTILNKKYSKLEDMLPPHLKNKDFEVIVHGNYLLGLDYNNQTKEWTTPEPIFNVQQLGLPENNRPLIEHL